MTEAKIWLKHWDGPGKLILVPEPLLLPCDAVPRVNEEILHGRHIYLVERRITVPGMRGQAEFCLICVRQDSAKVASLFD